MTREYLDGSHKTAIFYKAYVAERFQGRLS